MAYTLAEKESAKDGFAEYNLDLDFDDECQLNLKFRPFEVNSYSETGQAVLNSLYPLESKQFLNCIHLRRMILKSAECNLYLDNKQWRSTALEEIYHEICEEGRQLPVTSGSSKFKLNGKFESEKAGEYLFPGDLESTKMGKSGLQNDAYSQNHSNDVNSESQAEYQDESAYVQSKTCSKKGTTTSRSKKPSFIDILKDQNLLKQYANAFPKSNSIQQIVVSMTDNELKEVFSALEPIIRDVCKNKYGNYVIQIFAKNLPETHIPQLLAVVSLIDVVEYSPE